MRIFIAVLVLIFSLQSWTKAEDIRDFQIEGMSLYDSALEYFEPNELTILENNYKSILKTGDTMIKNFVKELEKIHSMKKAHNPLVDALFTLVVCIYIYI